MATYLFQKLTDLAFKAAVNLEDVKEASTWYRNMASEISSRNYSMTKFTQSAQNRFFDVTKFNASYIGKMMLFNYDAKHKETLPYYDKYPLVFPIELYGDGFLGINLHYLPTYHRAKLMDALYTTINNKKIDEKSKLRLSYKILNSASRFNLFKPCVKRYLYSNVKSRYFIVEPKEWDMTLMLPLQRFTTNTSKVYKDSLKKI